MYSPSLCGAQGIESPTDGLLLSYYLWMVVVLCTGFHEGPASPVALSIRLGI